MSDAVGTIFDTFTTLIYINQNNVINVFLLISGTSIGFKNIASKIANELKLWKQNPVNYEISLDDIY